jgi:hypothetical protein
LTQRWKDLFNAKFDVVLYDVTSTYFEGDPPFPNGDERRYGYSRDKGFDCVQVVIALVATPEGFPLAYEVMAGENSRQRAPNTSATVRSGSQLVVPQPFGLIDDLDDSALSPP